MVKKLDRRLPGGVLGGVEGLQQAAELADVIVGILALETNAATRFASCSAARASSSSNSCRGILTLPSCGVSGLMGRLRKRKTRRAAAAGDATTRKTQTLMPGLQPLAV